MTTLMLNSFLVLLMIFFGTMAYYTLFLGDIDAEQDMETLGEDRVISVIPAGLDSRRPTRIGTSQPQPQGDAAEHPGHRPAA